MRPVNLVFIGLALGGLLRPSHTAWAQAPASSATVLTIAGSGSFSYSGNNGPATASSFNAPIGLAIGPHGALLFVGDGRDFLLSPNTERA